MGRHFLKATLEEPQAWATDRLCDAFAEYELGNLALAKKFELFALAHCTREDFGRYQIALGLEAHRLNRLSEAKIHFWAADQALGAIATHVILHHLRNTLIVTAERPEVRPGPDGEYMYTSDLILCQILTDLKYWEGRTTLDIVMELRLTNPVSSLV
jgi:hypothetical protein